MSGSPEYEYEGGGVNLSALTSLVKTVITLIIKVEFLIETFRQKINYLLRMQQALT